MGGRKTITYIFLYSFIYGLVVSDRKNEKKLEILPPSPKSPPKVTVRSGILEGKWVENIAVFLGVPYAKPPIGNLKFSKPEPLEKSDKRWQTTEYPPACPQFSLSQIPPWHGDCLYLNIFAPNATETRHLELLPVLVWFHGGGYETGSAQDLAESDVVELAKRQIILVTVNYRLMFYGFFTTMTEMFPPNLSLHDQVAALEWIRREIQKFGGNSSRVTLAGHNTGASSISLLSYSPKAQDLFSQAILQSGTALNPFALKGNRYEIQTDKLMAVGLGCISAHDWEQGNFGEEFEICIKHAPPGKIWNTYLQNIELSRNSDRLFQSFWSPIVDGPSGLFPNHPKIVITRNVTGKKFLMGVTRDEKANLVLPLLLSGEANIEDYDSSKMSWLLGLLARPEAFPGKFRVISDLLNFTYTQTTFRPLGQPDHLGWINALVDAASDYWMNAGFAEEARRLWRSNGTVFLYSFDHAPEPAYEKSPYYKGIMHGTDLLFLFPNSQNFFQKVGLKPWNTTADDVKITELMVRAWTNFVKTGDPNSPDQLSALWRSIDSPETLAYFSLNVKPRMRKFHPMGSYLWNQLIPPLLSLPYNEPGDEKVGLDLNGRQKFDAHDLADARGSLDAYYVATWVLLGLCIVILLTCLFSGLQFRQKLHSYDLLRRVEELNFL